LKRRDNSKAARIMILITVDRAGGSFINCV